MKKVTLLFTAFATLGLLKATAQSTNPAPYCDASFDDAQGFYVDDHISHFSLGELTNTSGGQQAAPHYVYFNNIAPKDFKVGQSYDMEIKFEVKGGCGYGVWIDYNQNNIFEANEKVAGTTGVDILPLGCNIAINKSITIPQDAKLGNTRVRVRIVEDDHFIMNSSEILPCNASTSTTDVMDWGETEDYTINITGTNNTSIANHSLSPQVTIYPNPSTGNFSINAPVAIHKVQIVDMLGKVIVENTINASHNILINETLNTGNYFIKLFGSNEIMMKKIQVAK